MSYLDTYKSMAVGLSRGIKFLRGFYGTRFIGTIGLYADMIAEGCRQGFISGLPGHPECSEDSTNQIGKDRGLFRYRAETLAQWAARVGNAWASYEQAGTPKGVLDEVNYWGGVTYPATWGSATSLLFELGWARFRLWFPAGMVPWTVAPTYGGGATYGGVNINYGIGGVITDDLQTFRRIVRKWKPARSKGEAFFLVSGHVYGQPALNYGAVGFTYGPAVTLQTTI